MSAIKDLLIKAAERYSEERHVDYEFAEELIMDTGLGMSLSQLQAYAEGKEVEYVEDNVGN